MVGLTRGWRWAGDVITGEIDWRWFVERRFVGRLSWPETKVDGIVKRVG